MGVASIPGSLWYLYQLDEAIAQRERDLAELDEGAALLAEIERDRTRLYALRERWRAAVSAQKSGELELRSLADKRARFERDLYSGRITNPKELESMQQEIAMLDRQRSRLEDQVLTAMEEAEDLSRAAGDLEADLGRREAEHSGVVEDATRRRQNLEAELAELRAQRERAIPSIDETALHRYESVRAKLPHPVARVEGGSCGRCHAQLAARLIERLEDATTDTVILCPWCGRILVAP
jgi:predicted  nucleic acid-binding Zn-ribbon protein